TRRCRSARARTRKRNRRRAVARESRRGCWRAGGPAWRAEAGAFGGRGERRTRVYGPGPALPLWQTRAPASPVASVAKLVDARDSKSRSARSVGSIPTRGTKGGISETFTDWQAGSRRRFWKFQSAGKEKRSALGSYPARLSRPESEAPNGKRARRPFLFSSSESSHTRRRRAMKPTPARPASISA